MPTDNLEIFKKVVFHLPSFRKTLGLSLVLGVLYSILTFFFINELLIDAISIGSIPMFAFIFYLIPGFSASEVYSLLLEDYPRKWGYFLSMVNQLIIFLFTLIVTLSDSFSTSWQIIWFGLITLYVNNFFVLTLSVGPKYIRRISMLSLVQPVMILIGFHFVLGQFLQISWIAYAINFLVILGAGLVLLLSVYFTEYLVGSNVTNISILNLAAGLLQNEQDSLDLGRSVRPDVQTLQIKNRSGVKNFALPWIHPGPLEGFGGGKITSSIIDRLNSEDSEGFFLHVPSNHKMDPSDPDDSAKVIDALATPDRSSKASELISEEYGDIKFYGRRINDQMIVYMDHRRFDDYDESIFQERIDKEDIILIDLHNQPKGSRLGVMRYGTEEAEKVRKKLDGFLEKLRNTSVHDYSAGFSVEFFDKPVAALVEDVNGQKTLLFGLEGNDASKELEELKEEFSDSFDETLLFTTDTHSSIHDLASNRQVEKSQVRQTVKNALADVSPASIGFCSRKADKMNFLKDDYFGLIYTINILIRLIPVSLIVIYIALIIWLI
ncbi:MAG: putative membrane protein, DUF2070 [Candidatus Nanosalina sp. J07AB43]|nr:MAG: putative membrane protein, DUF2070 [Candidatus Nanosalina sp. J07AB43]